MDEIIVEAASTCTKVDKFNGKTTEKLEGNKMLENFESISPTAIVTSYPRTFTDIPYEKNIYMWLCNNYNEKVNLNKMLAPEIEARYKLINKLLDATRINQVLEIAAGYSSRGIIYSKKYYEYVEMDLEEVAKNKNELLKELNLNNSNLHVINGSALNYEDFNKSSKYFSKDKEIAIVNEGLLRYLTFDEKKIVATNIYKMLKEYNGVWITCDVTPKNFIKSQNKVIPEFNKNLNNVTSRNDLKDRFEDLNHIKNFMKEIGFSNVEIHKFSEVKDEIKSFDMLNIDKEKYDELLDNAIVAIITI